MRIDTTAAPVYTIFRTDTGEEIARTNNVGLGAAVCRLLNKLPQKKLAQAEKDLSWKSIKALAQSALRPPLMSSGSTASSTSTPKPSDS